ncbi:beta 1-4 rhamnosyltransferase Cps2T [Streptococcus caprae]|uniref:Beta 1-4 rhamnosyltransferase Cps2T n=1 Tax=Streptococcus caprae TaxID=1640501 RepID=A0ABV8CV22_9STRE
MQHVVIIGSRGLPAKYGGFETFVEELVQNRVSPEIQYHIACLSDEHHGQHFDYSGVDCFTINPPKLGPARVMAYDAMAIQHALNLAKKEQWQRPVFYVLGNTIGAFMAPLARRIHDIGGLFFINPDGLEWKRSKWPRPVQAYLKYAEKAMTKTADLVIADNLAIQTYIQQSYPWTETTCIAYGTDTSSSPLTANDSAIRQFFKKWQSNEKDYYLIVGRFVAENNYETAIKEFMASQTTRDLLIICNYEGNAYFEKLRQATQFDKDSRIKFVGTVYDKHLLTYIREQAFGYIHGHEVGGTNPGLLEALAHTDLNLILDVEFNRQVASETSLYWTKEAGSLANLINQIDGQEDYKALGQTAKARIQEHYTWEKIVREYEELFLHERDNRPI